MSEPVPEGWKVAVVSPEGEIAESIDIDGYVLDKPLGAIELGWNINQAVIRATAEPEPIGGSDG